MPQALQFGVEGGVRTFGDLSERVVASVKD
jgi:hypothetical protein